MRLVKTAWLDEQECGWSPTAVVTVVWVLGGCQGSRGWIGMPRLEALQ